MIRRSLLAAFVIGTAALAVPGGAFAQTKGGDVVIAMVQAPPSLDAHVSTAQASRNVTLHIYETLYARDESAKPVPELAEGVKISEDGRTYVFPIRKGVKFHNGKELNAEDVVASLERYRKLGASATLLGAIDQIKATGPHEITVTLKTVQSTFPDNLSSPRAPIAIVELGWSRSQEDGDFGFSFTGKHVAEMSSCGCRRQRTAPN